MSGSEHALDPRERVGEPTRCAPTDFMSRHEAVARHGDHGDRVIVDIGAPLNGRSEFVKELSLWNCWYNTDRPHEPLVSRTPDEVLLPS